MWSAGSSVSFHFLKLNLTLGQRQKVDYWYREKEMLVRETFMWVISNTNGGAGD